MPTIESIFVEHISRLPSTIAHAAMSDPHQHEPFPQDIWNAASLLTKPIHRLIAYPLLLGDIYNETPASHRDKTQLLEAKNRIERVARMANDNQRRLDVVRDILANRVSEGAPTKSDSLPMMVPKLVRAQSLPGKPKPEAKHAKGNSDEELRRLQQWETRLEECKRVVEEIIQGMLICT